MAEKRASLLKALLLTILMWGAVLLFFAMVSDFDAERSCAGD